MAEFYGHNNKRQRRDDWSVIDECTFAAEEDPQAGIRPLPLTITNVLNSSDQNTAEYYDIQIDPEKEIVCFGLVSKRSQSSLKKNIRTRVAKVFLNVVMRCLNTIVHLRCFFRGVCHV